MKPNLTACLRSGVGEAGVDEAAAVWPALYMPPRLFFPTASAIPGSTTRSS